MIDGAFALAFTAGMVATVNPCGFAMLPAYLSSFLGLHEPEDDRSTAASLRRALLVSAAVSLGFLVVFVILGAAIRGGAEWITDYAKYASIVIGAGLIVLGGAMLSGWRLPLSAPKLERGGRDRTLRSMFVFGVSYAVASLGCTIGPFLAVVLSGFTRDGFASGMVSIVTYGLGMAVVLTALTVTLALAKGGLLRWLRAALPYVDRVAGLFLILAGGYLVYYWIFNLATDSGLNSSTGGGLAHRIEGWSQRAADFIDRQPLWLWVLVGAALTVLATALFVTGQRRQRAVHEPVVPG